MTVQTAQSQQNYDGNGVTTSFGVPFRFLANSHIFVSLQPVDRTLPVIPWIEGSDYTLTGARNQNGGTITATVAPGAGTILIIQRIVPLTQLIDYRANDPFPEESAENGLDQLTMAVQQVSNDVANSFRLPSYITGVSTLLPPPLPQSPLVWAADGLSLQNGSTTLTGDMLLRPNLATAGESSGAALVAFQALGTGSTSRTVLSKLRDIVSVKDFGAIGDGNSHPLSSRFASLTEAKAVYPFATALTNEIDWAAFQAAVNAATGVTVPAGTYVIDQTVTNLNKSLTMTGSGMKSCVLKFGDVSVGLFHNSPGEFSSFVLEEISVTTTKALNSVGATGGVAVAATWPETFDGRNDLKSVIRNVQIQGFNDRTMGWAGGILYTNGQTCNISNLQFVGQDTNGPVSSSQVDKTRSSFGVQWQGGLYPTELKITDSTIIHCGNGMFVTGAAEGIYVQGCTFGNCQVGVNVLITNFSPGIGGGSARYRPLLNVDGCHFACFESGVKSNGMIQSLVTKNLFYSAANATQSATALNIVYAGGFLVQGNKFYNFANGAYTNTGAAIVVSDSNGVQIYDNEIGSGTAVYNIGIYLLGSSQNVRMGRNSILATLDISDTGVNNFVGPRGALVQLSADKSIPNSTTTVVTWDAKTYDTEAMVNIATGAITIPAGKGIRRIRITVSGAFAPSAAGFRDAQIRKNGTTVFVGSPYFSIGPVSASAQSMFTSTTAIVPAVPGDVFDLTVFQNTGGALNVIGNRTWLAVEVLD